MYPNSVAGDRGVAGEVWKVAGDEGGKEEVLEREGVRWKLANHASNSSCLHVCSSESICSLMQ